MLIIQKRNSMATKKRSTKKIKGLKANNLSKSRAQGVRGGMRKAGGDTATAGKPFLTY
jgi:hypothetical protein